MTCSSYVAILLCYLTNPKPNFTETHVLNFEIATLNWDQKFVRQNFLSSFLSRTTSLSTSRYQDNLSSYFEIVRVGAGSKCLHGPVIFESGMRSMAGARRDFLSVWRETETGAGAKLGKVCHKKLHPCLPDETSAWQLAFVIIRQQPLVMRNRKCFDSCERHLLHKL